jgi:hypothetical protein
MKHLAYNQKIIETRANHPADDVEKRRLNRSKYDANETIELNR